MTTEEMKVTLRQVSEMLELPKADIKQSKLALCMAQLASIIEDDDAEVPAEVFAELNANARKIAIVGLILVISQTYGS